MMSSICLYEASNNLISSPLPEMPNPKCVSFSNTKKPLAAILASMGNTYSSSAPLLSCKRKPDKEISASEELYNSTQSVPLEQTSLIYNPATIGFSSLLLVSSSTMEARVLTSSGVMPMAVACARRSLFQKRSCSFFIRLKKSSTLISQYT